MVAICPCCRQTVPPSTLLVHMDAGIASRDDRLVRLSPHEARALAELVDAAPGVATYDGLAYAVYHLDEGPSDMRDAIHLLIRRLRRKIAPLGARIISAHDVGYRLDAL